MTDGITDLSKTAAPEAITAEICVIGSGCGGATAARMLAEAGHEVVVLEEGRDATGAELTQRDAAMYDQLYMDRGGRASHDLSVSVLQGRVLGGGGVINACDVVPASDPVLRHWASKYGLEDFAPERFKPFQDDALGDLSASRIPKRMVNKANHKLREGAEGLGLRGEVMMHNRVGCQGLGTCLIGCPINAKQNPRMVALPKAIAAGARIFTRARAVKIGKANQELKEITVRTLDPGGYHEQGQLEIRAKIVIVAANAISSAQLLLRSGVGNSVVGKNLTLQPQLPIIGIFDERIASFDGIPQSYAVTEFEEQDNAEFGLWGYRIEAIAGTPGIVSTLLPYSGTRGMKSMARYDHMASSLLLAPDAPSGQVEVARDGRLTIRYAQRPDHQERLRHAVETGANIYLEAGAREVLVPTLPPLTIRSSRAAKRAQHLSFAPATAPLLSAHQQGTIRFAASERDGGADLNGQIYGTRDVYVFDSSGFPTSASSHTMTPIIATSRMLTTKLLTRI
ncbi:MAG: GMC family oxidoreductase N-terminal domain-containing protein [Polyangiales bacterium]|jgi:choline dehydrogenase-like flavoprotein